MSAPGKILDATPPSNPDAERAVLGAMILDPSAVTAVTGLIGPEHFLELRHGLIFRTIVELFESGVAVDYTTVGAELRRRGQLDQAGGQGYIASLEQYVFSTRNAPHHAHIVLQKHRLRQLADTARKIQESALAESDDPDALIQSAERDIFHLSQEGKPPKEFVQVGDLILRTVEEIEHRCQADGNTAGLQTGYPLLDFMTGGFQPSDLLILAARPSMGKTALALNLALNIGGGLRINHFEKERQHPIAIFSLEMSAEQVNQRLLSTVSKVPMQRMRTGKLDQDEQALLFKTGRKMHGLPIYVDDTPNISVTELRSKARRLQQKLEGGLRMIIIDYLQLMRGGARSAENRQQEISEITRSIKALARELHVPVLALSQLSRQIEQRKGGKSARRPMLSDLRESGAIEQDADVVMFIHREKTFEKADEEEELPPADDALLIIGKQRNGPIGDVPLVFFRNYATFLPSARIEDHSGGADDMPL